MRPSPLMLAALASLVLAGCGGSADIAVRQNAGSLRIPYEVARDLSYLELAVIRGIRNDNDLTDREQDRQIALVIAGVTPRLSLSN